VELYAFMAWAGVTLPFSLSSRITDITSRATRGLGFTSILICRKLDTRDLVHILQVILDFYSPYLLMERNFFYFFSHTRLTSDKIIVLRWSEFYGLIDPTGHE
jgi:hypothetical protein